MKININFNECEHWSDLDNYISDLEECGAVILERYLDTEEEIGEVIFTIETSYTDFLEKFKETDAYEYSSFN